MICFYHSRDLDGFCSGAIIKLKYPDVTLIGYDYGQPFPLDKISKDEGVIMVDVSLPMEDMKKLAIYAGSLKWIDHHKSAIDDFYNFFELDCPREEFEFPYGGGFNIACAEPFYKIETRLQIGIAACEIAWQDIYGVDYLMPKAIKLLGEYDTWRNSDKERWENEILPFQFGMREICNSPETFPNHLFVDDYLGHEDPVETIDSIIKKGKTILSYQDMINAFSCKKASFEFEFDGYPAICLNSSIFNSDLFKTVYDPEKHKLMMPFQFNGKFWVVSLYSTHPEIDCSVIAKARGGGGHKGAAGFQVNDIKEVFGDLI